MSFLSRMPGRMASCSRPTSASVSANSRLSTVSRHLSSSSNDRQSQQSSSSTTTPPLASNMSVSYQSEGPMRLYKLNRPKALNALNHEMILSMKEQMLKWRKSDLCRVIVGRGDERAFCAGGDVKGLILDLQAGKETSLPFFKDEFELNWLMARLGKPYVSVMDGIVMGGGCGIALPAPIRIATPRSHFAMPETKIGYSPDVGVNYYLAQLDGAIGQWLAVTGQDVYGRAVYELGLATHYIPTDSLDTVIHDIQQIQNPTLSQISTLISNYTIPPPPETTGTSSKTCPEGHTPIRGETLQFLNRAFGQEDIGAIYRELEKGADDYSLSDETRDWASAQKAFMDVRSPTGMAVALEGYYKAIQARRLDVTLENDMSMATAFSGKKRSTEDFITGVDTLLVKKSKERPAWNPSLLTDPSLGPQQISDKFFNPQTEALKGVRPNLDFQPPSVSKRSEREDSTWGQFGRYGLPTELEVEAKVEGYAPSSGAFKVTEQQLIERILDDRGETGGPRAAEFERKIKEIVANLCVVTEGGYLDWIDKA